MKSLLFVLLSALVLFSGLTVAVAQSDATESREFRELRAAAESGVARAQWILGLTYQVGVRVPKNSAEAVKWYRRAADQGNADAQYLLALMYDNGEGMPVNDAEAVKWYRFAADQGFAGAQLNLGTMYGNGEGVPKNDVEAYFWWNLAAAQGDEIAKNNRDIVEKRMTREQIAEAQRRSAAWKPRKE
jgi:TPR repeat protein